jgi:acyl-CoA hydrolase
MISVDENMNPKPVPKYEPISKKEKRRYKKAIKRRNFREKMKKKIK